MKNLRALLASCALGASLAACGHPTAVLAPESPRLNGSTFGGGHRASDAMDPFTSGGTTTDGTATLRGGSTFGGGH